jgi:flagellar basal body-associated protein FliL
MIDVTTRGLPSPCIRSRTEMSSVAIPRLSGNLLLLVIMLVIVMLCCSTCLATVTSLTNEQEEKYTATHQRDLCMVTMS